MTYAVVTARLLAGGVLDLCDMLASGDVVRQDYRMPPRLREALSRLARLALESGGTDLGASVHDAVALCAVPFHDWPVAAFAPPFPYADAVLLDAALALPTADCQALGRVGNAEDAAENAHHLALREALKGYGRRRNDAYTEIRRFVVANPVVNHAELRRFLIDHVPAAQVVAGFYRPIPRTFRRPDGGIALCDNCGAPLKPDSDRYAHPDGRCPIRACAERQPTASAGAVITDPDQWRCVVPAIAAYWVGPGLDELALFRRLQAAGLAVTLYPDGDAADIGTTDLAIGIDVKSYASPVALAERLNRSIGGLAAYARRIVAVPDHKAARDRDYLHTLRADYRGPAVEFATISDTVALLGGWS